MRGSDEPTQQSALEQRVRELDMMVHMSRTLSSTLDVEELLKLINKLATELVRCTGTSIILQDHQTGELVFRAASGPKSAVLQNVRVPIEGSIAGRVFTSRQPLIVHDTCSESGTRHYDQIDRDIAFDTQSILAVPMMFKERAIGVLEAVNKLNHAPFDQHDTQILTTLAAQAAIAIENARLVSELQSANAQLAKLDRLKSDFIAIASHELRTPLSLILGYASFLREGAEGATSEKLDVVLEASTQLKGLIDAMINLSHLDAGSATLTLAACDLRQLVVETVAAQREFAVTKSLEIRHDLPPTAVKVQADLDKIGVVLNNLLNNAIKFTPRGGRIRVAVRPLSGVVSVAVTDTGIGIPPADLERIFDRFYQVESPSIRDQGGMGLGLCIARGMIELHRGRIWAESVEGRGSRFTFTLPVDWEAAIKREESLSP
jgi:signal transduction histidine kinase